MNIAAPTTAEEAFKELKEFHELDTFMKFSLHDLSLACPALHIEERTKLYVLLHEQPADDFVGSFNLIG